MNRRTFLGAVLALVFALQGCSYVVLQKPHVRDWDRKWEKVRPSLAVEEECAAEQGRNVRTLLARIHRLPNIPDLAGDVWKPPDLTARHGGDCEDKAILLYYRMKKLGLRDMVLAIGQWDDVCHAWVEWRGNILDPWATDRPIRTKTADNYRAEAYYGPAGRYIRLQPSDLPIVRLPAGTADAGE